MTKIILRFVSNFGEARPERRDDTNAIKQLIARLRAALKPRG
jgi:hypothetical protein